MHIPQAMTGPRERHSRTHTRSHVLIVVVRNHYLESVEGGSGIIDGVKLGEAKQAAGAGTSLPDQAHSFQRSHAAEQRLQNIFPVAQSVGPLTSTWTMPGKRVPQ